MLIHLYATKIDIVPFLSSLILRKSKNFQKFCSQCSEVLYIYKTACLYLCIYTVILEKHLWTSDTFKKLLSLKVTLLYVCFSPHFIYFFFFILLYSFIIDNAKPTCLFFKLHDLFQIVQSIICYIIGQNNAHWKYKWWPLSWFPVRLCFCKEIMLMKQKCKYISYLFVQSLTSHSF